MATTNKRLCAGTLTDANATLYTVPTGGYTIIKAITLCNKTSNSATITIKLNSVEIIATSTIAGSDTITIPFIDQIIHSTELIEGSCSVNSAVNYYISGKEVTP